MKIDLSAIPLIDNHAHPFPTTRLSKGNYAQRFNFRIMTSSERCWRKLMLSSTCVNVLQKRT